MLEDDVHLIATCLPPSHSPKNTVLNVPESILFKTFIPKTDSISACIAIYDILEESIGSEVIRLYVVLELRGVINAGKLQKNGSGKMEN